VRIHILTLFPEFFAGPLSAAQMGRAVAAGLVGFELVNPRDFAPGRHQHVDDRPYGGGPGMVMQPGPLADALASLKAPGRVIALTPSGRPLTQELARELARETDLTLVCGRYEGFDERFLEACGVEGVCVGEAVLNGGEAAALCLVEAVARLIPGFMGKEESGDDESFSHGLLEYPHYTRPEEFVGLSVPETLRSGSHAVIARWRREQSLRRTLLRRPELLQAAPLDGDDLNFLQTVERPAGLGRSLFLCLLHSPVLDKAGKPGTVSLTNLDIHDMCRVSRSYELGGAIFATPLEDQRELGRRLLEHWTSGAGARANPDRASALRLGRMAEGLDGAAAWVEAQTGLAPRVAATSARSHWRPKRGGRLKAIAFTPPADIRRWLAQGPVLLVLGTGHGLAPEVISRADAVIGPVRGFSAYNHLPVRAAAAILVDRLLGDAW
jgi:tRNA (guanine37-N1)-methyltransferase